MQGRKEAKGMYKELKIWQKSLDLIEEIYELSKTFPKAEEYNLTSQIKRAVVSVTLNIAEGKCRSTAKDFAHFLNTASASLTEVEVIIEIAKRLKYIENCDNINKDLLALNKMINSLRSKLVKIK